jgi:hypothetical protein
MKIVLRRGAEEFALLRAAETRGLSPPKIFDDEQHALAFLRDFFDDETSLERMRHELFDGHERTNVMKMSQQDILREMAGLMARGIVQAVLSEVQLAQVYLEADKAKQAERSTGVGTNETLPSPIVPPEYPILARREADQVIDAMLALTRDLEAQLHDLFKRVVPPSLVAPEFVKVAEEEGGKINHAVFDLKAKIEEFLYRGMDAMPEPSLPQEYVSVAESESRQIQSSVAAMAAGLQKELYDGRPIEMPKPGIAPEIVAVAENGAAALSSSIQAMIGDLRAQLYPFDIDKLLRAGGGAAAPEDGGG